MYISSSFKRFNENKIFSPLVILILDKSGKIYLWLHTHSLPRMFFGYKKNLTFSKQNLTRYLYDLQSDYGGSIRILTLKRIFKDPLELTRIKC